MIDKLTEREGAQNRAFKFVEKLFQEILKKGLTNEKECDILHKLSARADGS